MILYVDHLQSMLLVSSGGQYVQVDLGNYLKGRKEDSYFFILYSNLNASLHEK